MVDFESDVRIAKGMLPKRSPATTLLSYRDSLIGETALRVRANTLSTEDMHHSTCFGTLELIPSFV